MSAVAFLASKNNDKLGQLRNVNDHVKKGLTKGEISTKKIDLTPVLLLYECTHTEMLPPFCYKNLRN